MFKWFLAVIFSATVCAVPVAAQNNEIGFSVGGGSLIVADDSRVARVFTLAYARYLTAHLAVEGSLETFSTKSRSQFGTPRDDFGGVQASAVYHLLPAPDGRFIPYLTAGIGATSDDFTEIPPVRVIRIGGGFKYFFGQSRNLGLRVEFRNEIINDGIIFFPPQQINFPSARAGVVYRF
jgi:hypothetical protein